MDVDGDIDSQLLQQFSSMATTDREVLISEFQTLLGYQLSEENCAFFLDMNNWNLQAAICSYLEYQQPAGRKIPQMSFVKDITIGEGESVPPNTKFTKMWRVQNTGDESWPPGCHLKFLSGDQFGHIDSIPVEAVAPGSFTDISVEMVSPGHTGIHQGQWRMSTASGIHFGEYIWMIIQVDVGGVLAVTQLLSQFGTTEHSQPTSSENPFTVSLRPDALPLEDHVDDWSVHANGVFIPSATFPRHSSLPSSPRYRGDALTASNSAYPDDIPRIRSVLFQTPDNSPSRTINVSRSEANHQAPNSPDFDMS